MPKTFILKTVFSRRMIVAAIMGYAAGLPLELTGFVLKTWMRESGVDLTVIGLMALVGIPYTLKFIQAPILDRFSIGLFGRRRGWLLIFQIGLILTIILLGGRNPAQSPWLVAAAAFLVTFFSASQDIVIDAYRREDLADNELGLGSSLYVAGYRIGMLLATSGGLIMADHIPFSLVYIILAGCLLPGVVTTLLTLEPPLAAGAPRTIREAVVEPFKEYFQRSNAWWILAFILLYKIGDTMAASMTAPFYIDMGFSKTEIGTLVKFFGTGAILTGSMAGGLIMLRLGIHRCLWLFGFLQALSTAGFALLYIIGPDIMALATVIAFENLSAGMGTAAYMAFMAAATNKKFTATQYALLTSLMGIPRVVVSASTGYTAQAIGWPSFFTLCTFMALPGMLLLLKIAPWGKKPQPLTPSH